MEYQHQFLEFVNGHFGKNLQDLRSPRTPIDKGKWKPLPGYRLKPYEMPINTPPNACQPRVMANYRITALEKPLEGHKPVTWT